MPSAIAHLFSSATQVLTPLAPSLDPTGFDTATLRIDYFGTEAALSAAYKKGELLTGRKMYCTGILSIEDARFGWITATIGYKGFWENAEPAAVISYEMNAGEIIYPFDNGEATVVYYGKGPGKTTAINTATGRFWRVRSITRTANITRSGVDIGAAGTAHVPPAGPTGTPPNGLYDKALANLPDPLLSSQDGWVRMAYSVTGAETIGTIVFRTWQDRWEWVEKEAV